MAETPEIDDATIDDLRARLRATRWPDAPAGTGWSLGVDVDELRALVEYWADGFDFDAHRATLAALPSRRVVVDGIGVHVLHARAAGDGALPVLLATPGSTSSCRTCPGTGSPTHRRACSTPARSPACGRP